MKFFFAPLLCLAATSASALTIPVNDTLVENNGLEKRNPVVALGLFVELLSGTRILTRTKGRLDKLTTDRGRPYVRLSRDTDIKHHGQAADCCRTRALETALCASPLRAA